MFSGGVALGLRNQTGDISGEWQMIDDKWPTENSFGYAKGRLGQGLADDSKQFANWVEAVIVLW